MIIPVPSSSAPLDFTSMDTTAGMTLSTSCGIVTLPLRTAAPGEALLSWMTAFPALLLPLLSAIAVTPAPMAPPISAATTATGSQARKRPGVRVSDGAPPGMVGSTGGDGYVNGLAGVAVPRGGVVPLGPAAGDGGAHAGGG